MAREDARLVEQNGNSDAAAGIAGPEASVAEDGAGSGEESQLCGIRPPEEKAGGAGVSDYDDHDDDSSGVGGGAGVVAVEHEKEQDNNAAAAGSETDGNDIGEVGASADADDGYHTPTSPQHRIPFPLACPPAPRKPALGRMRSPPQSRRRMMLDLDTKLLVATWWAERLLRQLRPEEEAATAKRPRIRDV